VKQAHIDDILSWNCSTVPECECEKGGANLTTFTIKWQIRLRHRTM